jgi:hypothetical protein
MKMSIIYKKVRGAMRLYSDMNQDSDRLPKTINLILYIGYFENIEVCVGRNKGKRHRRFDKALYSDLAYMPIWMITHAKENAWKPELDLQGLRPKRIMEFGFDRCDLERLRDLRDKFGVRYPSPAICEELKKQKRNRHESRKRKPVLKGGIQNETSKKNHKNHEITQFI